MLGVLVTGLSVAPAMTSLLTLPWVIGVMRRTDIDGWQPHWTWSVSLFSKAALMLLWLLLGLFLIRRSDRIARIMLREGCS